MSISTFLMGMREINDDLKISLAECAPATLTTSQGSDTDTSISKWNTCRSETITRFRQLKIA